MRDVSLRAGLGVVRNVVTEPVAICLAVVCAKELVELPDGVPVRVLIVDAGGGTTDLSVVQLMRRVGGDGGRHSIHVHVKATAGNAFLGGADVSAALLRAYLSKLPADRAASAADISRASAAAEVALRSLCDRVDMADGGEASATVPVGAGLPDMVVGWVEFGKTDECARLCGLVEALVEETLSRFVAASPEDKIDVVVLAGGASRVYPFASAVRKVLAKIGVTSGARIIKFDSASCSALVRPVLFDSLKVGQGQCRRLARLAPDHLTHSYCTYVCPGRHWVCIHRWSLDAQDLRSDV